MIADTMEHIRSNKDLLINIAGSGYWQRQDENFRNWRKVPIEYGPHLRPAQEYLPERMPTKEEKRRPQDWDKLCRENHTMIKLADKVLKHFEQGRLFSWLRGQSQ